MPINLLTSALEAALLPLPTGADPKPAPVDPRSTSSDSVAIAPAAMATAVRLLVASALQSLERVLPAMEFALQQPVESPEHLPLGTLACLVGDAARRLADLADAHPLPTAAVIQGSGAGAFVRPLTANPAKGLEQAADPEPSSQPTLSSASSAYAAHALRAPRGGPATLLEIAPARTSVVDALQAAAALLDRVDERLAQPSAAAAIPPDQAALWALATVSGAKHEVTRALARMTPAPSRRATLGRLLESGRLPAIGAPLAGLGVLLSLAVLWFLAGIGAALAGFATLITASLVTWRLLRATRHVRLAHGPGA